ncbi:histidine phosphatase family protein [Rhodovibrionaceae bacterium A322]
MYLLRHGQSHFNLHFNKTRIDPGIVDPALTEEGERQIRAAAQELKGKNLTKIIASPYRRTLESAALAAETLDLPIEVDHLVRERYYFTCDIGSHRVKLEESWPDLNFDGLDHQWWPDEEELEPSVLQRCAAFTEKMLSNDDWRSCLIVTHWGFIRGLTQKEVPNGTIVPFDPTAAPQTS